MDPAQAEFDYAWKQAIVCYIADFTAFFLHEPWEGMAAPESLDQELARCLRDGRYGLRRVDKLLRFTAADGGTHLWHIEFQAARQAGFAERMFLCYNRLYERFGQPVRSIAVLGDRSPSWLPRRFDLGAGATRLTFEFETVKLLDFEQRQAELLLNDNVFGWLVVAHLLTMRTRRELGTRMIVKERLLTALYACNWDAQKFRDVYDLIDRMMGLPDALQVRMDQRLNELTRRCDMPWKMLIEERAEERGLTRGIERGEQIGMQKGMQKGMQQGMQKGMQAGRQEALRQIVESMAAMRFGALDDASRRRLRDGTDEQLQRRCLAVLNAATIEDILNPGEQA